VSTPTPACATGRNLVGNIGALLAQQAAIMKPAILLCLAIVACGGDPPPSKNAVQMQPKQDSPLLGKWTVHTDAAGTQELTFLAGGKLHDHWEVKGKTRDLDGTYKLAANHLVLDIPDDDPRHVEYDIAFAGGGKQLLLPALRPEGAHQGIVGKWSVKWTNCPKGKPDSACTTFTYRMTFSSNKDMVSEWQGKPLPKSTYAVQPDGNVVVTDMNNYVVQADGSIKVTDPKPVHYPVTRFGEDMISSWVLTKSDTKPGATKPGVTPPAKPNKSRSAGARRGQRRGKDIKGKL
jgi:uncharacterized protein (TIGR03066 family)